jgi:hypothetical protein
MSNVKKKEIYDAITGDTTDGKYYGTDAAIFRKVDNVEMIFDSRGEYLGIRTCKGTFVNGKYTTKKGSYDFKSFLDLKIWAGKGCNMSNFVETKDGDFLQIDGPKRQ